MARQDNLRIHALLERSRANGPGVRAVLWVQGCTLGCPGCFNPETHSNTGGERVSVDEIARRILAIQGIEGITVSGGEPLQQIAPLTKLLLMLRQTTRLSSVVFTGFELEEIDHIPGHKELISLVDVIVAGRYKMDERLATGLRGSSNKQLLFLSNRYNAADFENLPEAEVIISPGGEITLSGIDPIK